MSRDHDEPGRPPSLSLDRRRLLLGGGLGVLGLNFARRLRANNPPAPGRLSFTPLRSCILIFYYGGPSHLDTWDMKPNAPREVRGEFRSIATNVPGIQVSEHLPHSARVVDRLAIIRSLHHPMTNHNAAAFAALSGRSPAKGDLELLANDRNDPPCLGSVLSHELLERPGLPTFVALPHVMHNVVKLPGQVAGFLGSAHDPFQVTSDPNAPDFRLDELELPGNVSLDRLGHREAMLQQVERATPTHDLDAYREKAVRLLHSDAVRRAFRLDNEDPKLRDQYGRTKHGQSLLLARRLVEAGVRFVTVNDHETNGQVANWDAHQDVFPRLKNDLLPPADRAFATLIEDLTRRGLLDSTLVIALGEFGRTPKLNAQGGRDHWPHCYSAVLAGGGVRGGTVYGASDKLGAYPDLDGVSPGDLAATLLWRFGLEPKSEVRDLSGRPYPLAEGQPLRSLFAG
ncbi:Protein of unknown function [Singulisphaera sp. GP187]|uniref:DUF1501 domain-containing protein n=1 Tax=Singulisphaera sp. GP187 TaxID=1882752 RepID=UPI000925D183|nr:DUF1501 domain-containing protein [Singulisphaera sp. GP187]SIO12496.1 Protein of unknown function [Singulisphaera sp. GP187]